MASGRRHRMGGSALAACVWVLAALAGCTTPKPRAAATMPATVPAAATSKPAAESVAARYIKHEYQIPMRDGVKLFTAVYTPREASAPCPIHLRRTPYGIGPYGEDAYSASPGPSELVLDQGYIFVLQDVRGCHMSEGTFVNMTPHIENKQAPHEIDESTDTYDTIDWLIKNIPNNNGRVGQSGISYPGFYCSAGMIDAHPALKAVSPQAPIADWWFDDFHHHGAFFLPHSFNFLAGFGRARPVPVQERSWGFSHGTQDGYQFFLDMGPLSNANEKYFHHEIAFWDEMIAHPNRDAFWQARDILPHLKRVAPAVMTVGGWFDAEDLYGALNTYKAIEVQNPDIFNVLVMGPWVHGGWARSDGDHVGNIWFDSKTSLFYREKIELAFFNHFLKDQGDLTLPEASVFETGANRWRSFDAWPPREIHTKRLYFHPHSGLSFDSETIDPTLSDEFVSDPNKPVPFTEDIAIGMTKEYMTDDQRFASRRPDVLAYQTEPLSEDITFAGPINAMLWVSTSGGDSDWIVKLIDVLPSDADDPPNMPRGRHMGGYQMMVRSEVMRGRFRNSYEKPEPFPANKPARVNVPLQDVLHTFKKGHRIMIQVQCTWFPLVDRNPQRWVDNIFLAGTKDFMKATQRVYRAGPNVSAIEVGVLPPQSEANQAGSTQ